MKTLNKKVNNLLEGVGKILVMPDGSYRYSTSASLGEAEFAMEPSSGVLQDSASTFGMYSLWSHLRPGPWPDRWN